MSKSTLLTPIHLEKEELMKTRMDSLEAIFQRETDFKLIDKKTLLEIQEYLNNRPK